MLTAERGGGWIGFFSEVDLKKWSRRMGVDQFSVLLGPSSYSLMTLAAAIW